MTVLPNSHATTIVLGERGVLITGASGSGKTALALALLAAGRREGFFARLVADDQVFLSVASGRIVARAPVAIAGLVEVRFLQPVTISYEPVAVIDLAIALVPPEQAERLPQVGQFVHAEASVPLLRLPANGAAQNAAAIAAWLHLPPFA